MEDIAQAAQPSNLLEHERCLVRLCEKLNVTSFVILVPLISHKAPIGVLADVHEGHHLFSRSLARHKDCLIVVLN